MHIYTLRCEMLSPASLAGTFSVFENPHNLARITPPWLNFRILTGALEMRQGAVIDYTIRWLGLPVPWRTLISAYEPPHHFVDEQIRGPYRLWRHRHTFEPAARGTLVLDRVEYALPLGALGRAAHGLLVGYQLREIFRYRQEALKQFFGPAAVSGPVTIEGPQGEAMVKSARRNCQSGNS
jgi:hypothetical protein